MVSEDSLCFIDIAEDSGITAVRPDKGIHMSMFVNDECYLCISNLGKKRSTVIFKEKWTDRVTGKCDTAAEIPAGGMVFLRKNS